MNLLFNHNNIYRLKDDAKIYIEGKNSVDNFLHSKGPHPFPDIATIFCTKGSNEISKCFETICSKIMINLEKHNNVTSCTSSVKKICQEDSIILS